MQTVTSISPVHRKHYEFWRAHKRECQATGDEFQRSDKCIAKWRDEESWVYHADIDDALEAKQYALTHEQHKAAAMAQSYEVVRLALLNANTLQETLQAHLLTQQADAMDIQAAYGAVGKAIACADTLYSISKLNVDVTDTRQQASVEAIRERVRQYEQGAQA